MGGVSPSNLSEGYSDISPMSFASVDEYTGVDSPLINDYEYAQMANSSYFAVSDSIDPSPVSAFPWSPAVEIRRDSTFSNINSNMTSFRQQVPGFESTDLQHFTPAITADFYTSPVSSLIEHSPGFDTSEASHLSQSPSSANIKVDDADRPLLNHFMTHVAKLIFPVLNVHQQGAAVQNMIIPALASNPSYLHCALNAGALHFKCTGCIQTEQIDNDIMRHRSASTSIIRQALDQDVGHSDVLETTLAMILFSARVGRPEQSLPDIPWHQHLQAATSLARRLQLPQNMAAGTFGINNGAPIDLTLTSWIDIIGATMRGTTPAFAQQYRDFKAGNRGVGLSDLTGCEDKVMFMISETACLEARKFSGLDEVMLCQYIESLGAELGQGETPVMNIRHAVYENGVLDPHQLNTNMTALWRIAARIYLCSLVPGFPASSASMSSLVAKISAILAYIPSGPEGLDRSLVWPLLMAGFVSTPSCQFRAVFAERCFRLGPAAECGSFGLLRRVLTALWAVNDANPLQHTHWRDIMRQHNWESLLI